MLRTSLFVIIAAGALLSACLGAGEAATKHAQTEPAVDHADLDARIHELNLESSTLEQAIDTVRKAARANLIVDWNDLDAARIYRDAPVRLHLWDVTLGRALAAILSVVDCDFASMHAVQDGVIVIATADKLQHAAADVRIYDVRDLVDAFLAFHRQPAATQPANAPMHVTGIGPAPVQPSTPADAIEAIAGTIENNVASDTWKNNGGNIGLIRGFAGRLIITQTAPVHRRIAALLRTLRAGGSKEGAEVLR